MAVRLINAGVEFPDNTVQTTKGPPESRQISSGSGLSGGGDLSSDRTISHANTSSQGSVSNSGSTFIQDISLDDFGHVTNIGSSSVEIVDPATYPAFQVHGTSFDGTIYLGSSEALNRGNNFNTSNGRFTAPFDGIYLFIWTIVPSDNSSNFVNIHKNGGSKLYGNILQYDSKWQVGTSHVIIELQQGDYIEARRRSSHPMYQARFGGSLLVKD